MFPLRLSVTLLISFLVCLELHSFGFPIMIIMITWWWWLLLISFWVVSRWVEYFWPGTTSFVYLWLGAPSTKLIWPLPVHFIQLNRFHYFLFPTFIINNYFGYYFEWFIVTFVLSLHFACIPIAPHYLTVLLIAILSGWFTGIGR